MSITHKHSTISGINPNQPETWDGKLFLSFDIDWAPDEVILDCFELVRKYSVPSTWFVTNESKIFDELYNSKLVEFGIHPNFNDLLNGKSEFKDSREVLQRVLSIIPTARSVRSHSLTQNERLIDQFSESGLTHVSNCFIPYGSGIDVKPYYVWDQIVIVPHSWQDNVSLKMGVDFPQERDLLSGFHVFNFHPIHVFLNTESIDRYESTRHLHQKPKELIKHRHEGYGTRNRLIELLELSRQL